MNHYSYSVCLCIRITIYIIHYEYSSNKVKILLAPVMSPSGEWTVLVTVSSGFQDMFDNWWHYFSLLRLSLHVIVIAEDNATYKNNIIFTVVKGLSQSHGENVFDYNTKQYKALVSKRPTYILQFIKRGLNVIYSDVDTIWRKAPRPFLTGDCDMWTGPVIIVQNLWRLSRHLSL